MKLSITPEMVYRAREAASLSKDSAARLACISRRTWDSWESGQRNMPESAFRFFHSQVTGNPLILPEDGISENLKYKQTLVIFSYDDRNLMATPIDAISTDNFYSFEDLGNGEASVTSMKVDFLNHERRPYTTKFKIKNNESNYNKLKEWANA